MAELNRQQQTLPIAEAIDPQYLLSQEGRKRAVATLHELTELLNIYKGVYSKSIVQFNAEMLKLASNRSPIEQADYVRVAMKKIQGHINDQANFYYLRESWIATASTLVQFFQDNETAIWIEDGQLIVDNDEIGNQLTVISERLDDIALGEHTLMEKRVAILTEAADQFGIRVQ